MGVQFQLDGAPLGTEDTTSPYWKFWNTTAATNGVHTLTAIARDAADNQTTSTPVAVIIANGATLDTAPPTVVITAPSNNAVVGGAITAAATANDNVGVAGVQFTLDGALLGGEQTTSPYSISWNTATATNGNHMLTAVARDAAGNTATSSTVVVTVANDTTAPVISAVTASSITASGATVSWTTDEASDSQVEYGLTAAYGGVSALNGTLATAHTAAVNGLTNGTLYHYRVRSRDGTGNLAVSGDFTFTTLDETAPTVAITAPTNGATISGTVAVTANASDADGVAGVQFQVDGAGLASEDTVAPYSVVLDTAGSTDLIFSVVKVVVDPITMTSGAGFIKRLSVGCPGCPGEDMVTEDKVQTVPGTTAATFTFTAAAHYVSTAAAFRSAGTPTYVQGATNTQQWTTPTAITQAFGGPVGVGHLIIAAVTWQTNVPFTVTDSLGNAYNTASLVYDPVNDQSTAVVYAVTAAAGPTTVSVSFGTPTPTVQRLAIHEYAGIAPTNPLDTAVMNIGYAPAERDGATAGPMATSVTAPLSNGPHTLSAVARDTAGNTTTSPSVTINVANTTDTTPPSVSITSPAGGATISGTVTVTATATDDVGVIGVQFMIDGAPLGLEDTASPYGAPWDTTTTAQGLHTLTAVARDAAGNETTSAAVSVTSASPTVQFTFSWDRNPEPDVIGYKIYFGTGSGSYSTSVDVGNVTTCTLTGFEAGVLYYFAATAYNANAESAFSSEASGIK